MGPAFRISTLAVARMRGRLERLGGRPVELSVGDLWLLTLDDYVVFGRHPEATGL